MTKAKQTTIENTAQWDFDTQEDKKLTPKHISFGDIPVKAEEIVSPAPVRKSRFVIEEASENTVSSQQSTSPNNLSTHSGEVLHIFTPTSTAESSWQSAMGLGLGISSNIEGEVKKGRFSVNQATPKIPSDKSETSTPIQPETPVQDMRPVPMERITSNESLKGGWFK
jgi:hypothetical protein